MRISAIKCFPMISVNFFILKNIRNLISFFSYFWNYMTRMRIRVQICIRSAQKYYFFFVFVSITSPGFVVRVKIKISLTYCTLLPKQMITNDNKKSNSDNKLLLKRCIEECQISLHNFYTNQNCRNF